MSASRAFILTLLLALLLLAAFAAFWAWWTLHRSVGAATEDGVQVEIAPGQPAVEILQQLEAEQIVPSAELARLYLVYVLGDPPLKAGEYLFSRAHTTPEVLDKLIRGEVVGHSVTLIEGWTLDETAEHLAATGFGDQRTFLEAMRRSGMIADLDPRAESLEGYLFPDTYTFARGTSEEKIVATLVETFRRHFEQDLPGLEGRDVRQLVTLASIVEKEARLDEERPLIAAVFSNRLKKGMGLDADPTIIYALKQMGTWDGNLRRRDLKLDSPYNTYLYRGLPPGPICSPGLASLRAAAEPAQVGYLYFVSRNDGSHVFATTLSEHNRNVERWQRQYWRERWARERREGSPPG